MTLLRAIWRISLTYVFGIQYLLTFVAFTVIKALFYGSEVFSAKSRPTPPPCLTDVNLGKHCFIKLSEVKLHYVELGNKEHPLIIFLHGFPDFWYTWRNQAKELAKNHWVICVDMRGYGDSDKPTRISDYTLKKLSGDVAELIKALGANSATLISHDWGAAVAWEVAGRHPQVVQRLIVMNGPHTHAASLLTFSDLWEILRARYRFFFLLPILPEIVLRWNDCYIFDMVYRDKRLQLCDHDIEAYKYTFGKPGDFKGPLNYYRSIQWARLLSLEDPPMPPKVQMPVLQIWGTEDLALSMKMAEATRNYAENMTIKMVKGAGHWVHQERPEVVNKYIAEFLEGKPNTAK